MHNAIHLQSNFCLAGVVRHKIEQWMRMVSVWAQLLRGLKGVLIQETFYGVEKGTDKIKMLLEQGNFYRPVCNRRKEAAWGKPSWEVGESRKR